MLGNYGGAEADLSSALTFRKTADAYVLRASARTHLGKTGDADTDIDAALKLDPEHPDALFERAKRQLAAGKKEAARRDWASILLHAPKSSAAEAARAEIAKLDFNPDR
jgi:Flp pilus assembly protein TadD